MDLPPSSHFIYIPVILILGLVLGFIWGSRTTREAFVLEQRRQEERARKKAERQAERQAEREAAAAGEAGAEPPARKDA
jgi:hypothetical protein